MDGTLTHEVLIASGIAIISIFASIVIIRALANLLIILAFLTAIIAPVVWYFIKTSSGESMPVEVLYLGSAIFAVVITILTLPLWPASSIMQWTGKKEQKQINSLKNKIKKTSGFSERQAPRIYSSNND